MKRILFSALLLMGILYSGIISAQSAEDIVSKHIEAIGGADKWKALKTMLMDISMKVNGAEIGVKLSQVNKKAMRTDISVMGMTGYVILTNTEGWNYMPFQGQTKPEAMTADDVKNGQDQLDFIDEFITYKEKDKKLESLGKDDVDGTECFKLKLTGKDGKESTYYIDPTTYYVIKQTDKMMSNGKEVISTRTYSDYQKLPEGIVFPMSMGGDQGEMKLNKVQFNTTIDDSIFKPSDKK